MIECDLPHRLMVRTPSNQDGDSGFNSHLGSSYKAYVVKTMLLLYP